MTVKLGDTVWWVSSHTGETTVEHGVIVFVSPNSHTASAVDAKGRKTVALADTFHREAVRKPLEGEADGD